MIKEKPSLKMESETPKIAKSANPLPYIIVFAILFIITLLVLTWTLYVWYQNHQCGAQPNFWCSDEWVCDTPCTSGKAPVPPSPCFYSNDGLASCLYGPTGAIATLCGNHGQPLVDGSLCACGATGNNCLTGCPQKLSGTNPGCPCQGDKCKHNAG